MSPLPAKDKEHTARLGLFNPGLEDIKVLPASPEMGVQGSGVTVRLLCLTLWDWGAASGQGTSRKLKTSLGAKHSPEGMGKPWRMG